MLGEDGGGESNAQHRGLASGMVTGVQPKQRPIEEPAAAVMMFDPRRRASSSSAELQATIASLIASLRQREADLGLRQRARKEKDRRSFCLAVECLVCNLLSLALLTGSATSTTALAVPRSSGKMWGTQGRRYASPVYGQHFLDVLDLMARPEVGLIEKVTHGYHFADRGGGGDTRQSTTIRPTPALQARVLSQAPISWNSFSRASEPEVLVLKGRKDPATGRAQAIDYQDTATTRRRRKAVLRLNAWLQSAPVMLLVGDGAAGLLTSEDGWLIDPTRRSLRRIFNNGDWTQGGRLFDGFWENMRRADRFRFIRIGTPAHPEGVSPANVDFAQLFPTLAYHHMQHEPPPEGDLYDIEGDGSNRAGWKKLLNALLFASEPMMTHWPRGVAELFPRGTRLRDAVKTITAVHAPIAPLFGTAIGFRLMLIESETLLAALGQLQLRGVTALPLHDSVLVAASEAETARDIMAEAFGQFNEGTRRAKLQIDFGK